MHAYFFIKNILCPFNYLSEFNGLAELKSQILIGMLELRKSNSLKKEQTVLTGRGYPTVKCQAVNIK